MKSCKRRFDIMKEEWYNIYIIKNKAMRKIVYSTTEKHRRAFIKWTEYIRTLRNVYMCKKTLQFIKVVKDGIGTCSYSLLNKSDTL